MLKKILQAEKKYIKWKLRSSGSKMINIVRKKIISMKILISEIVDKQRKSTMLKKMINS